MARPASERGDGQAEWQKPVTKDRNEVLSWLGANDKAAAFVKE